MKRSKKHAKRSKRHVKRSVKSTRTRTYRMETQSEPQPHLPLYTVVQNGTECLELLSHYLTPDFIYVSFGSAIPNRLQFQEDYNMYQIFPKFLEGAINKQDKEIPHILCVMVDEADEKSPESARIKRYITEYNSEWRGEFILNFIQINQNCGTEGYKLNEGTELYNKWAECVSETIRPIVGYLTSRQIAPERCIFANFVKFRLRDDYNVGKYLPTILTSHLDTYKERFYEWGGFKNPFVLYKYPFSSGLTLSKLMESIDVNKKNAKILVHPIIDYTGTYYRNFGAEMLEYYSRYFLYSPWGKF